MKQTQVNIDTKTLTYTEINPIKFPKHISGYDITIDNEDRYSFDMTRIKAYIYIAIKSKNKKALKRALNHYYIHLYFRDKWISLYAGNTEFISNYNSFSIKSFGGKIAVTDSKIYIKEYKIDNFISYHSLEFKHKITEGINDIKILEKELKIIEKKVNKIMKNYKN